MKLVVKSEAGTIFVLDSKNMTWVREPAHGPDSIFRVNEGKLSSWPSIRVGAPLTIRSSEENLTITSAPIKMVFEVGPHDEEMYGIRIPKSKAETQAYIDNYSKTGAVGKDNPSKIGKWVRAKLSAVQESRAKYPHCDPDVLHAPGKCAYCDDYPDKQKERQEKGINFTGERNVMKPAICPSEEKRSLDRIEMWPGNRPVTQADGFAEEEAKDPLVFATLPSGSTLRYTDETRKTFKYVPKGWTDLGPQDEPLKMTPIHPDSPYFKKETVKVDTPNGAMEFPVENWGSGIKSVKLCTRDEGHTGPCNGMPRIEREGMCYNRKKEETKDERRKELLSALEKATGRVIEQARYICEAPTPTVSDVSELRRLGKTYEKFKRDLSNLK